MAKLKLSTGSTLHQSDLPSVDLLISLRSEYARNVDPHELSLAMLDLDLEGYLVKAIPRRQSAPRPFARQARSLPRWARPPREGRSVNDRAHRNDYG